MNSKLIIFSMLLLCEAIIGETNNYFGDAIDVKTGLKVYSDNHSELITNGKHISSQIEYKDPQGKVFAKKSIKFNPGNYLPDFKLEDFRDGYIEGGEVVDGKYKMFYRKNKNEQIKEKIIEIAQVSVADGGFDPFIKDNWNDLMAGKKIKFKFYAPSQLDSFNFYVAKTKISEYEGRSSLFVKMELDNLLLNIFLPPIYITYDISTKRIVFYEGVSNVNNPQGKSYFVKLAYNHFK